MNEVQSRPRREYTPKPRSAFDYGEVENSNGGYATAAMNPPAYSPGKLTYVCFVRAVWVFFNVCLCVHMHTGPTPNKASMEVNLILKTDLFFLLRH